MPRGVELGEHGVEAVELLVGVRIVGLVGDREVGADALEHELGAGGDVFGERDGASSVRDADPVHAGVDLEVHGRVQRPRPDVGDRLGERVDAGGRCRRPA